MIPCNCKKKLDKCNGNCDFGGNQKLPKVSMRDTDDKTRPHCGCGYGSCICNTKYRKKKTELKNVQLEQKQEINSHIGRLLESLGG